MAEVADEAVAEPSPPTRPKKDKQDKPRSGFGQTVKKRWRAWLRALHRDIGYIAVGFTVIYALSGIAMNHIDDWDPNFKSSEKQLKITPIPADASDEQAVGLVADAAGMGAPSETFRAGDEVRLEYGNGAKVTAIGDTVTVQARSNRFFFRVAVWLHATRGKQAWKYISDAYAVLLLYLAMSGLLMIKGKLGLRWRGMILMGVGLGVPLGYIVLSGGPDAHKADPKVATTKTDADGIRLLPPEPDEPDQPAPERPAVRKPPADEAAFERPPVRKQPPPDEAAFERPPVRKQPPPDEAAPERPPVRKQPPPDEAAPERPPVRKQPPPE